MKISSVIIVLVKYLLFYTAQQKLLLPVASVYDTVVTRDTSKIFLFSVISPNPPAAPEPGVSGCETQMDQSFTPTEV